MKKVFIDGSAGTTGLRIFERLSARTDVQLITLSEEVRKDPSARKQALNQADVAFLCLPDDAAREAVAMVENPNTVIIDASTAHRTLDGWAYGFPELGERFEKKVLSSKRIAVPGCHASGFIALVYPLIEAGVLKKDALLCCHSLTGYSGGGKKMIAEYESADRNGLLNAPRQYALAQGHKHLKEMKAICGLENAPTFSPIVADFYSGMEVTVPLFFSQVNGKMADIIEVYKNYYTGKLVKYCDDTEDGFMSASKMAGRDSLIVSVHGGDERMILTARFDNLGKGASGSAIQNMNIVLGVDETLGLNE